MFSDFVSILLRMCLLLVSTLLFSVQIIVQIVLTKDVVSSLTEYLAERENLMSEWKNTQKMYSIYGTTIIY